MQQKIKKARYENLHKKNYNKILSKINFHSVPINLNKIKFQRLVRDLKFLKLEGCLKGYFLQLGNMIPSISTMSERTDLNVTSIVKTEENEEEKEKEEEEDMKRRKVEKNHQKEEIHWNMTSTKFNSLRR